MHPTALISFCLPSVMYCKYVSMSVITKKPEGAPERVLFVMIAY